MQDFEGDMGDRRQELVFIGIDIKRKMLTEELNRCLMATDLMGSMGTFEGDELFLEWPTAEDMLVEVEVTDDDSSSDDNDCDDETVFQS